MTLSFSTKTSKKVEKVVKIPLYSKIIRNEVVKVTIVRPKRIIDE